MLILYSPETRTWTTDTQILKGDRSPEGQLPPPHPKETQMTLRRKQASRSSERPQNSPIDIERERETDPEEREHELSEEVTNRLSRGTGPQEGRLSQPLNRRS